MRRSLAVAVIATVLIRSLSGIDYPQIASLRPSDPLFQQHQEDIRLYFFKSRRNEDLPPLVLYSYDASEHDSLLTISARLNLPYASLATLNGLVGTDLAEEVSTILVPSVPGMFIPAEPRNHIDRLLSDARSQQIAASSRIRVRTPLGEQEFFFLPGEDFLPGERRSFLGTMFAMPVEADSITSRFGYRRHPITDIVQFHRGVDFAAPSGAPVRASADGVVALIGFDTLLGSYVVLRHGGGYETYYAHLSKNLVTLNESVASGTMIGRVGSTGLTTGPHLHFELREAGRPRDPLTLLPKPGSHR